MPGTGHDEPGHRDGRAVVDFDDAGLAKSTQGQCDWSLDNRWIPTRSGKGQVLADDDLLAIRAGHYLDRVARGGEVHCGLNRWSALLAIASGVCIFIAFALIAAQILVALIEAYVGIAGGVLILGFSGSRWTMKFAESFIGWYLGVCTKIFFLFLLVGIGLTLTDEWNQTLQNWKGDNVSVPIAIAGAAFIFFIVARQISNTASAMVGQSVTMHAGHVIAGAAATYGSFRAAKMFGKAAWVGATGGVGLLAGAGGAAASGARSLLGDQTPPARASASPAPASSSQPKPSQTATTRLTGNTQSTSPIGSARGTNGVFYNPDGSAWTAPPSKGGTMISKPS